MSAPTSTMSAHANVLSGLLMLGLAVLLGACANLPGGGDQVPVTTYLLDPESDWQATMNPAGPTLLVNQPGAAPGYTGTALVYVRQAPRLEQFAHHRWSDSPAAMLHPLLVRMAESSGLFRAVLTPQTRLPADRRLDTEIVRLRQRFAGETSDVELVLRARLVDLGERQLTACRVFVVTEPADSPDPTAGAAAANRAVARLLGELASFLATGLQAGSAENHGAGLSQGLDCS